MKALIFAAGLGTRLKPLTDTMPKAMVPVQGEPLLAHVLRKLKRAGCKEAVVNVHHFADQISDYLATHDFGLSVSISDERDQLLETGGGIKKAAHLLGSSEPFLVHNVDILSNLDLAAFYALHKPERLASKTMKLIIGNKNYSSWSLRGWLAVKHSGLPFEELQFDLGSPDFAKQVAPWSPTGLVPNEAGAHGVQPLLQPWAAACSAHRMSWYLCSAE